MISDTATACDVFKKFKINKHCGFQSWFWNYVLTFDTGQRVELRTTYGILICITFTITVIDFRYGWTQFSHQIF